MRLVPALTLALALATASCGEKTLLGPAPELELIAQQASVKVATTQTFMIHNRTGTDLWYNLCGSPLQRKVIGGAWITVSPSQTACLAVVYTIKAGETVTAAGYSIPSTTAEGRYRIVATFGPAGGEAREVVSTEFDVTR